VYLISLGVYIAAAMLAVAFFSFSPDAYLQQKEGKKLKC
jgi:hypothetical protein